MTYVYIRDFWDPDALSFQMLELSRQQILWLDAVEVAGQLTLLVFLFLAVRSGRPRRILLSSCCLLVFVTAGYIFESFFYSHI